MWNGVCAPMFVCLFVFMSVSVCGSLCVCVCVCGKSLYVCVEVLVHLRPTHTHLNC